jgi:hypothetical protein
LKIIIKNYFFKKIYIEKKKGVATGQATTPLGVAW